MTRFDYFLLRQPYFLPHTISCFHFCHRLESLNDERSGVVQMVKLAEKERDGLEV